MSEQSSGGSHGYRLIRGAIVVFLAEALLPLTGIVTSSILTRRLGEADYGLFTLAATLTWWTQFSISALFARATIKLVAEAEDWRPIAGTVLRTNVWVSALVAAGFLLSVKLIAALLGEPRLVGFLALCAVDIPVYTLAICHSNILIGKGLYTERARVSAVRWIARMILIVGLVEAGFSVYGAIVGTIGASVAQLLVARHFVRPSWAEGTAPTGQFWDYAFPIFISALALQLMNMDLFVLKILGASAADVGIYGAAQNISMVIPGIYGAALSPLLLSTISQVLKTDDFEKARLFGRNALRGVVWLVPFAFGAAGASHEMIVLLFGWRFAASAPLFNFLVFGGLAKALIHMQGALLIANGKPSWVMKLTLPLLPVALAGHLLFIPRYGRPGAAAVSTGVLILGMLVGMGALNRAVRVNVPALTVLRSALLSAGAFWLARIWPTAGIIVVLKLILISALIAAGFVALGELRASEVVFFRSLATSFFEPQGRTSARK